MKATHIGVFAGAGTGKTVEIDSQTAGTDAPVEIELDGADSPAKTLDLMFVIDTTGSMGDELSYLQTELEDVIKRVKNGNAQIPTRLSVNFYRDYGDEYVVLPHEFTEDIPKAIEILKGQSASGGGDIPEKLDEALMNAVFEHKWNEDSVKLMFVVLDAPCHDDDESVAFFKEAMVGAAVQGIRIVPVMSSGADLNAEFLLRSLAISTGGTFTFLTDDSGYGNPHADPSVSKYNVEMFNDMLVRIINDYLK
jgi:hypothetical protein